MSPASDEIVDKTIQAMLASGFVIAMPRARIDVYFDLLASDRVSQDSAPSGLLMLEMQLTLAR